MEIEIDKNLSVKFKIVESDLLLLAFAIDAVLAEDADLLTCCGDMAASDMFRVRLRPGWPVDPSGPAAAEPPMPPPPPPPKTADDEWLSEGRGDGDVEAVVVVAVGPVNGDVRLVVDDPQLDILCL